MSLASKLAEISNPNPKDFDPEDFENTNPESYSSDENDEENDRTGEKAREHYVHVGKSSLRDNSLKVDDVKYKGSKVSRGDLFDREEDNEDESGEDIDKVDSEDEDEEDSESESEEDTAEKPEAEDEQHKREELKKLMSDEQKKIVSRLSDTARADAEKGQAVHYQMNIYEGLLDSRINLQKAVAASNILPVRPDDISEDIVSDETTDLQAQAMEKLIGLMDKITQLRIQLMKNDKITDDEFNLNPSKKRNLTTAFEDVEKLENPLATYRNNILEKWSRKIQSSSGNSALQNSKFRTLNQTAAVQVNGVLADMDRLVKRTRTNRSDYKILGEDAGDNDNNVDVQENPHIFDDTDFYRLQLKDLVDRRMADSSTAGDVNGMKWAVSKAKSKKNIDTKASKGRKLRYHVQEKVQGFDAPRPHSYPWSDEKTDELFSSLFGGKFKINESDDDDEDEESEGEADFEVTDGVKIFG